MAANVEALAMFKFFFNVEKLSFNELKNKCLKIISQKLIEKCGNDKDFAKQLCMANELQYE